MKNIKTTLLLSILIAFVAIDCSKLKKNKEEPQQEPEHEPEHEEDHHDQLEGLIDHIEGQLEVEHFAKFCTRAALASDMNFDGKWDVKETVHALQGVCKDTGVLKHDAPKCVEHLKAELGVNAETHFDVEAEFCGELKHAIEIRLDHLRHVNEDAKRKELWLSAHAHAHIKAILDAKNSIFEKAWLEFQGHVFDAFSKLDADISGKVDLEEAHDALVEIAEEEGVEAEVLLEAAVAADVNADGGLDFQEFLDFTVNGLVHAEAKLRERINQLRHEICLDENQGNEDACVQVEAQANVNVSGGVAVGFAKSRKLRRH